MAGCGQTSWSTSLRPAPPPCSRSRLPPPKPFHPLAPKRREADMGGRRSSGAGRALSFQLLLSFRRALRGIYLPWQGHRQLSSVCPVPLPPLPQPSPATCGEHLLAHGCVQHCEGSDLGFSKLSLPDAAVAEWLSSLNTVQSLNAREWARGTSGHRMGSGRSG